MTTEEATVVSAKEKLELVCWLTKRQDDLRVSIANRAVIVVSADALLLAGVTFLLDKALSGGSLYSYLEKLVLIFSISATVILLAFSLVYATTGVASVWKSSRKRFGSGMPQRLFFHAFDTIEALKSFSSFEKSFEASTVEEMLTYALADLWSMENQYRHRYQMLTRAIRLLLFSIIPFLASINIILVRLF